MTDGKEEKPTPEGLWAKMVRRYVIRAAIDFIQGFFWLILAWNIGGSKEMNLNASAASLAVISVGMYLLYVKGMENGASGRRAILWREILENIAALWALLISTLLHYENKIDIFSVYLVVLSAVCFGVYDMYHLVSWLLNKMGAESLADELSMKDMYIAHFKKQLEGGK